MSEKEMDPTVKQFLEEDCKAGEYAMMTVMVNQQYMKEFVNHLNQFYARLGLFKNGTDKAAVLGLNKRQKLEILKNNEEK